MTDLFELFIRARPTSTKSTAKTYASTLRTMLRKAGKTEDDLDFLSDYPKMQDVLAGYADGSRRNVLNAIIVLLRYRKVSEDIINKYVEDRDAINKKIRSDYSKGDKTERQDANWVSKEEYDDIYEAYSKSAKKAIKAPFLVKDALEVIQDWVVLSLYRYLPPRRLDYADCAVVTPSAFKALEDSGKLDIQVNYLITGRPMTFVFNRYKTSKIHGQQKIEVPKELEDILHKWLGINSTGWLLFNGKTHQPMNNSQLGRYLSRIFEESVGKKVGSQMLRRIYLTEEFGDDKKKRQDVAEKMGHSLETQNLYVNN